MKSRELNAIKFVRFGNKNNITNFKFQQFRTIILIITWMSKKLCSSEKSVNNNKRLFFQKYDLHLYIIWLLYLMFYDFHLIFFKSDNAY